MRKIISIILLMVLSINNIAFAGVFKNTLIGDYETGDIIYQENADEKVSLASITKIMTYLVVMEEISSGNGRLDDIVTIDAEAAKIGGSSYKLKEGDRATIEELLEATLIISGNDACLSLAKYFDRTENKFVDKMNLKAKEIGIDSAIFYTATGIPNELGQHNSMSMKDLFKLSRYVIEKYPEVLDITKKEEMRDSKRDFVEENSNRLIGKVKGIDGLKTGYTEKAGRCLVATGELGEESRVIAIFMGANSEEARDKEATDIMTDIMGNYEKEYLYNTSEMIKKEVVPGAKYKSIKLYPKKDVEMIIKKGDRKNIKETIVLNEEISYPIKPGDTVGKLILEYDGVEREVELTVLKKVGKFKLFTSGIFNFVKSIFTNE